MIDIDIDCDNCGDDLSVGDAVFCHECYQRLEGRIEELEVQIQELQSSLEELEDLLSQSESAVNLVMGIYR